MKEADIRRKYIEFFKSKGHQEIQSAPVIPENDPTCLFTTAGMHPLVPYLQGAKHPAGKRRILASRDPTNHPIQTTCPGRLSTAPGI